MERRRSSGTIAKSMYYSQKRILAFLLTAAMVFTNLGTGLNVSYAGTADQVTFQMKGADLVAAVEEAIESGHEITADDLGFTNGRTAEFEKVFFGTKGAVYEVYPEMEGSSMEAELRVFVRLPEDAGDMYMVTGDEEIILLYVNNGEDTISCTTEITRMDDGVEKVKKTKRVTIRSYEDAFGDEEVDIISKPVQEETEASESETSAESGADGTGESALPEESADGSGSSENSGNSGQDTSGSSENSSENSGENQEETSRPEDGSLGSAGNADHSTADTEAAPTDDAQGTDTEKDNAADTKAEVPEKNSGSGSDEKPQKDFADQDKDTQKQEDREEKSNKDEDKKEEGAVPAAAISRHDAPVVSEKEEGSPADSADVKENMPEKEEVSKEKETEPREKEEHGEVKETGEAAGTEKEKETETVKETEKPSAEETREPAAPTTEVKVPDTDEVQTTKADDEGSVPESTQASDSTDGSSDPSSDSAETSTAPSADVSLPSESEQETAPEPVPEDDTKKASTSDLAGMGYCSTAKVYTTSLNQLKALEDFDGYKVTYTSFPEASARIMEGPRGVKEGESLTFGVKTQLGYTIDNVTANDEDLEADSVTDELDGSQTAWYTISEVYEEQNIQVYTLETLEHPAFDKSVEVNGVTIRITAPEGVLPADTQIQAEEITEQVESALTEKVDAESDDGTMVSAIIAYDINLMYDGVKLDNSWAEDGSNLVTVSFSGDRIEKASMEADQIEILHLETPTQEVQAVSAKAELEGSGETEAVAQVPVLDGISADDIAVDSEGRQELDVSGSASVGQIHFQTDHFSAFTAIFKTSPYLVIANERQEDSKGEEDKYTYEVSITDSRMDKNEKLYLLTDGGGAEEYKKAVKTSDGDTNTYTFELSPNGRMKIGNVGASATYTVTQTDRLDELESVSRKKIWSDGVYEEESESETGNGESEEEKFPYGYDYSQDAYGTLMERASALLRAYGKCKSWDEKKKITPNAGPNDSNNNRAIAQLLYDHTNGGNQWPLAEEEGFGDVADKLRNALKEAGLDEKIYNQDFYLHIYFKVNHNQDTKLECVPYLTTNNKLKDWEAYAVYNSDNTDSGWFRYYEPKSWGAVKLGSSIASLNTDSVNIATHVTSNSNWTKFIDVSLDTKIEEDLNHKDIEGSFTETGITCGTEITFNNVLKDTSTGDGSTDNGSSGNDSSEKPDNDSNNGNGNESGGVPGNDTADTDTSDSSAGGTTNTSQGSEGSGSSGGGTTTSGGTGRYQGTDAQSGPGAQQNVIESSQVPLASLPADASAAFSQSMAIIDDGEIPLAAIPKTGDRGSSAHELSFILSGMLMAVYLVLGKKKKES